MLALVAVMLFSFTATYLEPLEAHARKVFQANSESAAVPSNNTSTTSSITLSKQLFHRNFIIYCVVGVVQVFNCHFNSNLLALVLDRVFDSSPFVQTAVLCGSAVFPQICVALLADWVVSHGLYKVVTGLLLAKTLVALLNSFFGDPGIIMLGATFLLANKVVTEVL